MISTPARRIDTLELEPVNAVVAAKSPRQSVSSWAMIKSSEFERLWCQNAAVERSM